MQMLLVYLKAFLVGGALCAIGQVFVDKTKLTPARILVGYVVGGVVLSAFGLYKPLIDFAGAGASVPLTGFGHLLANGVREALTQTGLFGALTGGLTATAGGIAAAIVFALAAALVFKPGDKS
ncbi:MAG: stage V sporulation protein AE [Hydrogenoanaerobacterium sp.]